jgi:hypothetical protein
LRNARFYLLIATMYPCPCGYANDPVKACTCFHSTVTKYQKRISDTMLDRIDIHVEGPCVDYEKLRTGWGRDQPRYGIGFRRCENGIGFVSKEVTSYATRTCMWRKFGSFVNWMKREIAWYEQP